MANFQAIMTVCEAVRKLLESNYRREDFNNTDLEFRVNISKDFSQKIETGVSLFLYRVFFNGSHRTPAGRYGTDGQRYNSQLPVDLHFILTAWGNTASMQQIILGWMMRTMEDNPIIPSTFLQNIAPGVFHDGETVEISLAELTTEDLLRLWEVVAQNEYQISVPYVARNVRIESTHLLVSGQAIQERAFDFKPDI
jgi:hypothetical protein